MGTKGLLSIQSSLVLSSCWFLNENLWSSYKFWFPYFTRPLFNWKMTYHSPACSFIVCSFISVSYRYDINRFVLFVSKPTLTWTAFGDDHSVITLRNQILCHVCIGCYFKLIQCAHEPNVYGKINGALTTKLTS